MAPSRPRLTPTGRLNHFNNRQDDKYAPMHILPAMNLSPFDPTSTKLDNLKERLKVARKAIYELNLQAANIEHQLYLDWDSLSMGQKTARDRHNELAMEQKEWYRELRDMHKQRIHQLELEIQQESDYMNWRNWSPVELLLRWKSGKMDYSIFKEHEATYRVQDAFRLEAGLLPPKLKVIAMVSAQVAAGFYQAPIESIDWGDPVPVPGYVDEDFGEDDAFDPSPCAPRYNPQLEFTFREKQKNAFGGGEPGWETHQSTYKQKAEQYDRGESQPAARETLYEQEVGNWDWDVRSGNEGYVEGRQSGFEDFDDEFSITGYPSQSGRSWVHNYPTYEYSQEELDEITAKAFMPEKPKKVVPMIAGRPFSRPILAEEYVG